MRWRLPVLVVAAAAAGCACHRPAYGPPPAGRNETPEGMYAYFRECVHSGDYTRAWWCLSREGREDLPNAEFEGLLQSYGQVRDLITGSRITEVSIEVSGDRAEIKMENTDWEVDHTFRLAAETVGAKRLWQVDLTRTDLERIARRARGYGRVK
jgi:hypothetical protein